MAEKKLTIEGAEPLLLFGFNDAHLKQIEAAFADASIVARGNQVILRGEDDDIEQIERVINELVVVLNRNTHLTENDVSTVLDVVTLGGGTTRADMADVILFTPNGGAVRAKTPGQHRMVESARKHDISFSIGPAGTGKTYTAVAIAAAALKSRHVKRIVLCRPAVEAGERLGFLPGDLREKVDPYLRPLYDALEDMFQREKLRALMEQNTIEIVPLAYMRGRTMHSAFVILDEAQNATSMQMKMFLTRLGANSRCIVNGDITQIDLPRREQSGLIQARNILEGVEGIGFVYLDESDVVRHRLVKEIIAAYERAGNVEGETRPPGNGRNAT